LTAPHPVLVPEPACELILICRSGNYKRARRFTFDRFRSVAAMQERMSNSRSNRP